MHCLTIVKVHCWFAVCYTLGKTSSLSWPLVDRPTSPAQTRYFWAGIVLIFPHAFILFCRLSKFGKYYTYIPFWRVAMWNAHWWQVLYYRTMKTYFSENVYMSVRIAIGRLLYQTTSNLPCLKITRFISSSCYTVSVGWREILCHVVLTLGSRCQSSHHLSISALGRKSYSVLHSSWKCTGKM